MAWTIEIDDAAFKQLAKMGRQDAKRVRNYLRNRIEPLDNPRQLGKALEGSKRGHLWRYRVGDYRIICDIQDHKVVVLVLEIGHRREIYR
ncbi:type II toxin-antitoxin system RelE/ParE family toxin [Nitratireductor thuwali]|uniref:type II toxin-antitoxin system RelE family toxin n=1 Tax=Nitratireductor thuwali TaxID=2267699 RepID=UPI0030D5F99A